MQRYPESLEKILYYFRKLPGVGRKTAERFVFQLIEWKNKDLQKFAESLDQITSTLSFCPDCGALQENVCPFCNAKNRDCSKLCIVACPRDIFFIEESNCFQGQYHALKKLLSPIEGIDESFLRLNALEKRFATHPIQEVIFALESTVEGDATMLFLKNYLQKFSVTTSRLALGIPLGSSLEYTDGGTLAQALSQRQTF